MVLEASQDDFLKGLHCSPGSNIVLNMCDINLACHSLRLRLPKSLPRITASQYEIYSLSRIDAARLLAYGVILINHSGDGFVPNPVFIDSAA